MNKLLRRLRESNASTASPQLLRGDKDDDDERDLKERDFSDDDRKRLAKAGDALPDGSFPIETKADLENAVSAYGRAKDKAAAKAHITKRAKALGATATLPADWDGSTKKAKETLVPQRLNTLLREAAVRKLSDATDDQPPRYEVTLVREGMGNQQDRRVYTREALQSIVEKGLAEGLQAYANHPTSSEEKDQPERDIRKLVGHYEQARLVETAGVATVTAVFVPITGDGYEWVVSLIESALANSSPKPLAGISILGDGLGDEATFTDGMPAVFIREIDSLESADLVTKAGAGGTFLRRLQEGLRGLASPGVIEAKENQTMKPTELQDKMRAATALLREAAQDKADKPEEKLREAFRTLDELAGADVEAEVQIREVEKPVAASDEERDQLAAKLKESEKKLADTERERDEARGKVSEYDRAATAAKVLREAEVAREDAERWLPDLAALDSEDKMKRLVENRKAERDAILATVRESFAGVQGAGPRVPAAVSNGSRDPFADAGVSEDEIPEDPAE